MSKYGRLSFSPIFSAYRSCSCFTKKYWGLWKYVVGVWKRKLWTYRKHLSMQFLWAVDLLIKVGKPDLLWAFPHYKILRVSLLYGKVNFTAIWTAVKLLFHVEHFSYDFCFHDSSLRKLTGLAGDAVVFSLPFLFMQTSKCQASY